MAGVDLWLLGAILAASGGLAFVVLLILSRIEERRRRQPSLFAAGGASVVFLFEDEAMVDATPNARQLLAVGPRDGTPWTRLMHVLVPRFPNVTEALSQLADAETVVLTSTDGRSRLEAEWRQGLARLTLVDAERQNDVALDRQALAAMEEELATLRGVADEVPYLTWKEAADGTVVWANAAFLDASERLAPPSPVPVWPPHPVFPPRASGHSGNRVAVKFPDDRQETWYELRDCEIEGGLLRAALPADAIVHAERSRADFVQTLTKTFANLTVGLAIFDRSRRLALFNPALTDLTGLPAEFLALRPSLESFLHRLREARMLPEPKNYGTWRQKLSALEHEAETGTYAETWTLPDGQVYEVTGRPHPDGAIAFLIEDVSAEMRLTRRFRAELQLNQAVIDTLPDALAVFADDGVLTLANAAYCRMWNVDARSAIQTMTLVAALRAWRADCPTTPDWARLTGGDGRPVSRAMGFAAERLTGRRLNCRFQPLPGGALLASFTEAGPASPVVTRERALPDAQLV